MSYWWEWASTRELSEIFNESPEKPSFKEKIVFFSSMSEMYFLKHGLFSMFIWFLKSAT